MFDIQTTAKRRIELLALCSQNEKALKAVDLATLFGCEELTIKRDMQELRSFGIQMHSTKKQGIVLENPLKPSQLKEMIIQYMGLAVTTGALDKATSLLVEKRRRDSLCNIVALQRAIENRRVVYVDYEKKAGEVERRRKLCPLQIFQADSQWRVLAMNEGKMKHFLLTKIHAVKPSEEKFEGYSKKEMEEMFRYSFRSFVGPDKFRIRLVLGPKWAELVSPRQLLETEKITEHSDGSVELDAIVNNLEEVAGWVVSRGDGIRVLDPPELKTMVITLAKGVLRNYSAV